MTKLVQRIAHKLAQDQLPHLIDVIIPDADLEQQKAWICDFYQHYEEISKKRIENQSDVTELIPAENGKYDLGHPELPRFEQNLQYRPIELPFKITVFFQANTITTSLANRLLKSLEEPPKNNYFFFIHDGKGSFIPTVKSRTVTLRETVYQKYSESESINFEDIQEIISQSKKREQTDQLVESFLYQQKNKRCTAKDKISLLSFIHQYDLSKEINLQTTPLILSELLKLNASGRDNTK